MEVSEIITPPLFGSVEAVDCFLACQKCMELGKCIINDRVNECLEIADQFDGFVFGTPVYYASANSQMPIVSSQYWNEVHGNTPEEVKQDIEGMQTMRTLAQNMAFMLKCKEAGLKSGVEMPKTEETVETNFIR